MAFPKNIEVAATAADTHIVIVRNRETNLFHVANVNNSHIDGIGYGLYDYALRVAKSINFQIDPTSTTPEYERSAQ